MSDNILSSIMPSMDMVALPWWAYLVIPAVTIAGTMLNCYIIVCIGTLDNWLGNRQEFERLYGFKMPLSFNFFLRRGKWKDWPFGGPKHFMHPDEYLQQAVNKEHV